MGRFLRKRKGAAVGEIAVVGVRTRARAALAMAANSGNDKKIRNTCNVNELSKHRRRRSTLSPEISVTFRQDTSATVTMTTSSVSLVGEAVKSCSDFPATSSCCTSNKDRLEITSDLEVTTPEPSPRCFDYCRPARPQRNSGDRDSPPKSTSQIKMPSDADIEEFFSAAEKDLHKRFTDKYNFDIVKDVPLEGRYEWVPIKP